MLTQTLTEAGTVAFVVVVIVIAIAYYFVLPPHPPFILSFYAYAFLPSHAYTFYHLADE